MYIIKSLKELEGKTIKTIIAEEHMSEIEIKTTDGGIFIGEMSYGEISENISIKTKKEEIVQKRIQK